MRIVFMGSPEFAVAPLEYLVRGKFEVVAVFTRADKPAGRGRTLAACPVKRAAESLGLPVYQPASLKKPEAVAKLADLRPDVVVVAAYGQILPPQVLSLPPRGCLNIHPSLLPKHRGASPIPAALLAGDEFTGVSIMLMDEGVDTGPVLSRAQVPILNQDTAESLTGRLSQIAAYLVQDVLIYWERDELTPQPQIEAEATYSPLIKKSDGEIDWTLPAAAIFRRVRAFQPWPGTYTHWQGKRLEIIRAVPLPWESGIAEAGKVVDLATVTGEKGAFGVVTGDGLLSLCQVKLEGKRAMPAAAFIRGQPAFIGSSLR